MNEQKEFPDFKEVWEFQGSWAPTFLGHAKQEDFFQQRSPICLNLLISLLTKQIKHNSGLFQ